MVTLAVSVHDTRSFLECCNQETKKTNKHIEAITRSEVTLWDSLSTSGAKSLEDSLSTSGAKTVGIPVGKDPLGQTKIKK